MPELKCPRCGLYNPEAAERCDCGYDFASGEVKAGGRQPSALGGRLILGST